MVNSGVNTFAIKNSRAIYIIYTHVYILVD